MPSLQAKGACNHRVLAIGHLHQTEQLAWEWPGLCKSIRAARYRYQQRGTIPDFEALVQIVHFHMHKQEETEAGESQPAEGQLTSTAD